jgi:hypothetical protein
MKALPHLLLLLLLSISIASRGQAVISGTVIDAESRLPLHGASVFAQNTTKGAVTDKEGTYRIYLNKGGYELVTSFTGYNSNVQKIEANADQQLQIELKKEEKSLDAVVVSSSFEVKDGWEKHGDFFLDHFIGATPAADSCLLTNPEVLKFFYYKRSDRLKVTATEPLIILNHTLGYHLRYQLDSFVYHYKTNMNLYRGSCFYTPMEGAPEQQEQWKQNRQNVYYGSRLHFLRSYHDSSLKQEGFTVDILSDNNAVKFNRLGNPYDTLYYAFDNTTSNAELWFPKKASISYIKKAPEQEYLQQYKLPADVKMQISYVDLAEGILILPNGFFFDQRSWVNQGYWSWKNLADQLPYDYVP